MAGPQGWQKHLSMHKSVFRSDSQPLEWHKAMLQPAPRPCPAMDPAMDPGMAAESARKGVKTRALCAKRCWLWGAVGQWTSAAGAAAAVVSVCAAVHRSAALLCPACRHHNACPNPTGCFLHCPCPCTARQRGRGGKAVNPLSDLAACKCRNRVFQTAPASGHCVLQRLPQASAVQTGRQGGLPCKRGDSKTAVPGGSADPCRNLHRQWQKGHRRTC